MSEPENTSGQPNDLELVERTRKGDAEAFEQLLDRHQGRVQRLVLSILRDPMDAQEVVQDVFLTVFEKIDRFRGEASFTTWLHRVALNAALMRRRRQRVGREVSLEEALPAFADNGHIAVEVPDWSGQADDPLLQEEARLAIAAAVDQLDDMYRTVFVLRDVEGFSTEEVARVLEMSVPAVKSRLHRARLFLRRELADYFEKQAQT